MKMVSVTFGQPQPIFDAAYVRHVKLEEFEKRCKELAVKWRKDADQYMRQVGEARQVGTPHDQMFATALTYRECAKAIESIK